MLAMLRIPEIDKDFSLCKMHTHTAQLLLINMFKLLLFESQFEIF